MALLLVGRSAFPWLMLSHTQGVWGGGGRGGEHCDLPVWRLLVSAGLGRLLDSGGGSGGAASSGGEFQTARRGFVLIFVFI